MRLRWLWYAWTDPDRPWIGTDNPCDDTYMALFHASTEITLGDGAKCLFWHDHWMLGSALRHQFPDLFTIATRKRRSVQKELHQQNWIRSLARISTMAQLRQFIALWTTMQGVVLQPYPDLIRWRWTELGIYTTAYAYRYQFMGSCAPFRSTKFWKGHVEAK
jgi:hypothetical protein